MKPRILFVDHAGVLGGAELSLLDIARHFAETSRVTLFERGPFLDRLRQEGVAAEVLPAAEAVARVSRGGGLLHDLKALPGVLKLAWHLARQARACDVLYANSQKAMVVAALAGFLARRPVIWHLRDLLTTDHFSRLHCRTATLLANCFVARVIANSGATRRAFIAGGGEARRVFTVHNGISGAPFESVAPAEVDALRRELGLDGVPLVGAFSRLAPWKGQHVLLQALRAVPRLHALLVGSALFDGDASYAEALRRQADDLGVADRVHFLGFRHDVPQLLRLVDVVAHTSTAPEPFGRVIVEGMLAGRPVVATRAGGAVEIVRHEETGLLVPPGNPGALAAALERLLNDPALAQGLAAEGRRAAQTRFSVDAMLHGIEAQVRAVAA